jgi:hypothetical protein
MKVRSLLFLTALVSSILGAIVVYLFLSVPNDLKADALLKDARAHMAAGRTDQAHDSLARVIQQYPRTDAAAAATVALVKLEEQNRQRIDTELARLQKENSGHAKAIGDIQKSIVQFHADAAAAKAATVTATAKAPAKATSSAKKTTTKKTTPKKKTTRRKR